jgi:hypothetical protein
MGAITGILLDGDPRNLRDENVTWVGRPGARATYMAVWCARWRRDRVAELMSLGVSGREIPKRIAALIAAARAAKKGEPK